MNKSGLFACIAFVCVFTSSALVPSKFWTTPYRPSSRKACRLTMYFDDASRYSSIRRENKAGSTPSIGPKVGLNLPARSTEKHEAIQRMLLGYNAESASKLSHKQVLEQMEQWAEQSGVVDSRLGDERYRGTLETRVCTATSAVGAMADFWRAVVNVIDDHTDEHSTWIPSTMRVPTDHSNGMKPAHFLSTEQLFLIFPNCPELYNYKTMFTLVATMEFSKEICQHLGKQFSLTLFHPQFKNSPKMLSPEKHSPFPCSGLQFGEPPQLFEQKTKASKARDDENERNLIGSKIPDLDAHRKDFEVLFNSAAAPDSAESGTAEDNVVASFSKRFESLRRESLPTETVKDRLVTWIGRNRYLDDSSSSRQPNRALLSIDTVGEDRWVFSENKMAEKVFLDVWKLISELYDIGQQADKDYDASVLAESGRFVELLPPQSTSGDSKASGTQKITQDQQSQIRPVIVSSLFVPTKFCAYNAHSFKRFAVTINAALKRLTGGQMFLEVFHPEHVGKKDCDSATRRAPFPMMQVCYETKAKAPIKIDS